MLYLETWVSKTTMAAGRGYARYIWWKWTRPQQSIQVRTKIDQPSKPCFTRNAWEFLHYVWKYTVECGPVYPSRVKALEINNTRSVTIKHIVNTWYCWLFRHWQTAHTRIHHTEVQEPMGYIDCYSLLPSYAWARFEIC